MRAFVTGAAGFVGGHLAARLSADGWEVRALVRKTTPPPIPRLEVVKGDIRDERLLRESLAGADVVFHLAAALGAARLPKDEFAAVNAGGTQAVLAAARATGIPRIVHVSSAGVLGHVKKGVIADERHPLDPRDPYDRSKLESERIALDFAAQGLPVVVVRPGWVYGPGDGRTFKLVRAIASGRFALPGRGLTLQTPIHVDDLVDGLLLAADKGRRGEIYHLAGGEAYAVRTIVEVIAEALDRRIPRLRLPMLPTRAAAWLIGRSFGVLGREAPLSPSRLAFFVHPKPLSIAKAASELGFSPRILFRDGMASTVAWYKANGWL